MAGRKKQPELAAEEKLQQALVPKAEQPYKVPDNWCYFYFTSLIDIEGGTQPPKSQFIAEPRENYIRLVQIRDFATNKYAVYVPDSKKLRHFENKDILIARYGASLGRICTGMNGVYNVALAKTIFSENVLNRKYVYRLLQSDIFQIPLLSISRTAQAGFNKDDLSEFPMPLPPLAEQQRIVERIETLFAKLDEAKEKLQNTLDTFETRKAAILHKAFTGELTANWRKQHGLTMDSWEEKEFAEVADIKSNLVSPFDYLTYPHIAPDNIEKKTGKLLYYNSIAEDKVKSGKHRFYAGQILYSKIRPYLSKVIIANFDGLCSADMYPIEAKGDTKYLWYYMLSEKFVYQASTAGSRTVLPKINQKELSKLKISISTLDEQTEIVRIIDNLLAKEQKAYSIAQNAIAQIDLIKKSILARAFRGQLATNNPADEPAIELLKRVL